LSIPHLTTDRLLLRAFEPDDVEPYVAMMARDEVTRYLGDGRPLSRAAAALRFARETLGRTDITSIIRPANVASIRVAESLGAVAAETVEFFGAPSVLYRYPPE
jgi:RimJ/RimL family protein N-acetyltransferase